MFTSPSRQQDRILQEKVRKGELDIEEYKRFQLYRRNYWLSGITGSFVAPAITYFGALALPRVTKIPVNPKYILPACLGSAVLGNYACTTIAAHVLVPPSLKQQKQEAREDDPGAPDQTPPPGGL